MEESEIKEVKPIEKQEVKITVNKLGKGIAIYITILYLVTFTDLLIKCIKTVLNNLDNMDVSSIETQIEQVLYASLTSGTSTIIGIILGMIFLIFYFRKFEFKEKIFGKNKKMSLGLFIKLLIIVMSLQFVFSILSVGIESILNSMGYSIMGEIEEATQSGQTISMFLYICFIAPISEEIVFRGFLLRGFQKYGKEFAIIMTAVLFGASHANIIQGLYATLFGLVLGYIACNYSIKWTILLHMINNFVFGDLFSKLISGLSDYEQGLITIGVEGSMFLAALLIVLLNKEQIKKYIKKIKFEKNIFYYAFSSMWILIFLIPQILQAILGIQKM